MGAPEIFAQSYMAKLDRVEPALSTSEKKFRLKNAQDLWRINRMRDMPIKEALFEGDHLREELRLKLEAAKSDARDAEGVLREGGLIERARERLTVGISRKRQQIVHDRAQLALLEDLRVELVAKLNEEKAGQNPTQG